MIWVRSTAFAITYWALSLIFVPLAFLSALLPGRATLLHIVNLYARSMRGALKTVAGIEVLYEGARPNRPCIVAAKHHSWHDGFMMLSHMGDLAFVTSEALYGYPLMARILDKLGAMVVSPRGGHKSRSVLTQRSAVAHHDQRSILIYPEGRLSLPGEYHAYKTGVYHLYRNLNLPVYCVGTNLGVFAPQQAFRKTPGRATLEFMEPIEPGLKKKDFMALMQDRIETSSNRLISQATNIPYRQSILVEPHDVT